MHAFFWLATTGNVTSHGKKIHGTVVEALARLIEKTPAEEALAACSEYMESLGVASGSSTRFFGIASEQRITQEVCALIWFIDAFIPFAQFDNPLFKQFCEKQSGNVYGALSSTTTIMETMLPAIYEYVTDDCLKIMKDWVAFFNTLDG